VTAAGRPRAQDSREERGKRGGVAPALIAAGGRAWVIDH
jgi:hypothetical protein